MGTHAPEDGKRFGIWAICTKEGTSAFGENALLDTADTYEEAETRLAQMKIDHTFYDNWTIVDRA